MRRTLLTVGLTLGLGASTASAQSVGSFSDLHMRLNLGDKVTVVDTTGGTWRGRLAQVTPQQLILRADSRDIVLARDRVQRVGVCCDSLLNGTLIGAGAGGAFGMLAALGFSDQPRAEDVSGGILLFGAIGAGLGIGFDALIQDDVTVYRAPAATIEIVPDPARRGLRVVVRW